MHLKPSSQIIFLIFLSLVFSSIDVKDAFEQHGLDVASALKAPEHIIYVKYKYVNVKPGDFLGSGVPFPTPDVSWDADPMELYTLLMYDPDIPSRKFPILRSFLHWLVVNIPGDEISKGDEIASYFVPIALPRSGMHRYTFLVFQQIDEIQLKDKKMLEGAAEARIKFPVADFVRKFELGDPMYGNFFQYQYDIVSSALEKNMLITYFHLGKNDTDGNVHLDGILKPMF